MLEYREHRQELIKDSKGQIHPVFKYQQNDIFWGRVLGNVVTSAYFSFEIWDELSVQAAALIDNERNHMSSIKQTASLPEEYLAAILKFEHYLKQSAKGPLEILKHSVVASPAFRPFFERIPPPDIHTPRIGIKSKGVFKADKSVEHLQLLLQTLWEDGQNLFLLGMNNVVDELQHLLQSEPKASNFVSAYLAEVIGDLSISCECLRQVQTYYPWAANFENAFVDRKDGIQAQFAQRTAAMGQMMQSLHAIQGVSRFGNPEDGKFKYPIDKRRTKETVDQLRKAEGNLDTFWKEVDRITSKSKEFSSLATGQLLKQAKILKRTPEWVEPAKEVSQTSEPKGETSIPLSSLYFNDGKSSFTVIKPKEKKKTRGTPATTQDTTHDAPAETKVDEQPVFELDNRAIKVFRTVFYTPSLTATPGEVPWTDFVHAMISTGFAAEKLYGLVWQFSPARLDVDRSIQFHEPHPVSKLPYRTARRFGRRLNKAYGWHGGMFVLKA